MKLQTFLTGLVLVASTATITSVVVSGPNDEKKPAKPDQHQQDNKQGNQQPSAEEQEMMRKWMEFATPGENHNLLASKVGKWTHHVTMREKPDQAPSESDGTTEYTLIMDGRYLIDTTAGTTPWGPFEGRGCTAYDNMKKKFVATWIDNMGTGIMYSEGTYDAKTKTFTYKSKMPDVETGKYIDVTTLEKVESPDKRTMEMWQKGKDGKEWKSFEIAYTRVK